MVRQRDFRLIAEELVELSETGMLVVPKLRVLTGESLIVSFMAPYTRMFIDADATVARVVHGRRLGDEGPGLGLELTEMDELGRSLLRTQLAHVPSAPPRRRWIS